MSVVERGTSDHRRGGMVGTRWFNGLSLLINSIAVSIEVFIRRDFGGRYIGAQAVLAAVLIPGYCQAWSPNDAFPMVCFYFLFLGAAIAKAIRGYLRMRRGQSDHTRYSGRPNVLTTFPRQSDDKAKKYVEPMLVFIAGMVLLHLTPALALYLCVASACLHLSAWETEKWMRKRAWDMNDAVCEQQDIAERFRGLRGE
ncbi:MAG TPA: hypothetical protein VGN12_12025 [Pirellulales bacterium]|jgi:hypothetical protein